MSTVKPTPSAVTYRVTVLSAGNDVFRTRMNVEQINRASRAAIVLQGWYLDAPESIAARLR